jgi:hypothetical protein
MILPALAERDTRLSKLLTLAVKTLEVLMNYSQDMHQSFRDLDGVNTVSTECGLGFMQHTSLCSHHVYKSSCKRFQNHYVTCLCSLQLVCRAYYEVLALSGGEAPDKAAEDKEHGNRPMETDDDKTEERLKTERELEMCKLLAAILHLLSSAATPVASSSDVRELATGDKLPFLLKIIFEQPEKFGATVYEKASALLTEFVHQEPGCLQVRFRIFERISIIAHACI